MSYCSNCFEINNNLHKIYLLISHKVYGRNVDRDDLIETELFICNSCLTKISNQILKNHEKLYELSERMNPIQEKEFVSIPMHSKIIYFKNNNDLVLLRLCDILRRLTYIKAKGNEIENYRPHNSKQTSKFFGFSKQNQDKYGVDINE